MITGLLALCMVLTMFAGCAAQQQVPETTEQPAAQEIAETVAVPEAPDGDHQRSAADRQEPGRHLTDFLRFPPFGFYMRSLSWNA